MKKYLINEKEQIDKLIAQIEEQLSLLPKGTIYCKKTGNYTKWYKKTEGEKVYLSKKEIKEAAGLAQYRYLSQYLEDLCKERNLIGVITDKLPQINKTENLIMQQPFKELLDLSWKFFPMHGRREIEDRRIQAWINEPFEANPNYPENLIHKTVSGTMVRSKSEAIIANALTAHNILFKYECPLEVGGVKYYPDFTIFSPRLQHLVIWEHFGKMGDHSYRKTAVEKMYAYESIDIYSPKNLIITSEDPDRPLSMTEVEHIINDKLE